MKEAFKHANKYSKSLNDLHHEFCPRFLDFEKVQKSFQIVSALLSQVAATAPQEVQLELIDLQNDYVLKKKFKTLKLNEFYASPSHTRFPEIRKMAQKMLVLFGSSYICEQTFSQMNFNKSKHRSQLTDAHFKSVQTIATITPQPPQRGGAVPNPIWVGSKWLLAFPRVPATPGTSLHFFAMLPPERPQKGSTQLLQNRSPVFTFSFLLPFFVSSFFFSSL